MFSYLIDRDQEDNFRFSKRQLTDVDGAPLSIRAFRIVWRWFDHLVAYEFGPDAQEILNTAHKIAARQEAPLEIALGHAVAYHLYELEQMGGDVTDDNIELVAALRSELERVGKGLGASPFPK
ncbi:MAG: hypothetical protein ACPGNV_05190 [Mangrovicoccus sp.]